MNEMDREQRAAIANYLKGEFLKFQSSAVGRAERIPFICANCHQDKTLRETKSDEFRDYRNHLGQWIYHMNRIESNKKQPKPVVIPNKNPVGRPHKLSADLRKRVNFKLTPLMANWLKQQKNITATIEKLITEAMIDDP
jgi:hypothetical protein